ncbi:TetR/AcrR family transcriptional regulator [Micromonosporaceae bacterium DT194]|uniref:TetR/AcrR family transcriptional regulator n=1 Tax=Melissospora conviva TaxID=3388432 RepID=UPI003C213C5C
METGSNDRIDAHVRRLWRHRGTTLPVPRRGPRHQLSLDTLLDTAVTLADGEGLAAVSTRSLAAELGVSAMGLYPYVGSKEQLVALMADHAYAAPERRIVADEEPGPASDVAPGIDAGCRLRAALEEWVTDLFDLYVAHPWLTEISWATASGGPNEQDWLERLLSILDEGGTPVVARAAVVTTLYAVVRSTAQTAAAYGGLDADTASQWLNQTAATRRLIGDFDARYPRSVALEQPAAGQWRDLPRASLRQVVALICAGMQAESETTADSLTAEG